MGAEPPALGKGLFGYRKAAVNQILSDRDVMLRQAEGRVRAAESKVAQLEGELGGLRDRNSRMEEQLERLRVQLNTLISQGGSGYAAAAEAVAAWRGRHGGAGPHDDRRGAGSRGSRAAGVRRAVAGG